MLPFFLVAYQASVVLRYLQSPWSSHPRNQTWFPFSNAAEVVAFFFLVCLRRLRRDVTLAYGYGMQCGTEITYGMRRIVC